MAVYQFVFKLIPKEWVKKHPGNKNNLIKQLLEDDSVAWNVMQFKNDVASSFSNILAKTNSWHANLEVFGNSESNDIQVWNDENGNIQSFTIRLDLRSNFQGILEQLILLSKSLACVFFIPEFEDFVNPDDPKLKEIIKNSRAARFVNDPVKFIENFEK